MKIVFFPVDCCPFDAYTLDERPLGGTETGVIRLAQALHELGQEVYVVTQEFEPPESKPTYLTAKQANQLGLVDAVVIVRGWKGAFLPFESKKRFFWTGDAWDNSHTYGIGDQRFIKKVDGIFAVSDWQADTLSRSSGFPREKISILRNGIHIPYFSGTEQKKRKRLIYSSTPMRGLKYLPKIYLELKSRHADLEMHIFSSADRYAKQWPPIFSADEPFEDLFATLNQLPDVRIEGSILQKNLAREFMKASILAYPTDFEETSCITAMEAQAAGCVVVTSDLAALKETVGSAGFLLQGDPSMEAYQRQFIEICDRLLSNDSFFEHYSNLGKERALGYDWKLRAEDFLKNLQNQHGLM